MPAAVLSTPAGPTVNHIIIFAVDDWRFEIISPSLSVDELSKVAEGISLA
jgi:hypothetical protein